MAETIEKGLVADIKAQNGLLSNKVKLLSWVAKGLLLRGHKYAWNIVQVMLDKLSSDIGGLISPNMEILLEETSSVLSKETNATIKVKITKRLELILMCRYYTNKSFSTQHCLNY